MACLLILDCGVTYQLVDFTLSTLEHISQGSEIEIKLIVYFGLLLLKWRSFNNRLWFRYSSSHLYGLSGLPSWWRFLLSQTWHCHLRHRLWNLFLSVRGLLLCTAKQQLIIIRQHTFWLSLTRSSILPNALNRVGLISIQHHVKTCKRII